ncbi:MAG: sulfotransferase, partial [Novosphingobium sp.]|nr:sulfotransferase [Novosphingobium sp.]
MAQQLVAEALVEQAMTQTGIDAFDNDSYREGLDVFVNDFNKGIAKGIYTEGGIQRVIHDCVHYLGNRLRVTNYLSYEPQLLQRKIERPVFVMGIPRTGTTLLSNLLAADPARRSPLEWEIDEPVPPATTETLKTDTRALAKIQQHKQMLEAHPEMGKIYRSSPIYPHECVWYLAHDFKTLMIES